MVEQKVTSVTIDSRFQAVGPAVEKIVALCRRRLTRSAPADALVDDLRLGLTEALNNVIEHAYGRRSGFNVVIDLTRGRKSFVIRLRDTGRPMPKAIRSRVAERACSGPAPDIAEGDVEALAEGGWGLFMLQETMDRIAVERSAGENILTLEKCFAACPADARAEAEPVSDDQQTRRASSKVRSRL